MYSGGERRRIRISCLGRIRKCGRDDFVFAIPLDRFVMLPEGISLLQTFAYCFSLIGYSISISIRFFFDRLRHFGSLIIHWIAVVLKYWKSVCTFAKATIISRTQGSQTFSFFPIYLKLSFYYRCHHHSNHHNHHRHCRHYKSSLFCFSTPKEIRFSKTYAWSVLYFMHRINELARRHQRNEWSDTLWSFFF